MGKRLSAVAHIAGVVTLITLANTAFRAEAADLALRPDPTIPKNIVQDAERVMAVTAQQLTKAFPKLADTTSSSKARSCVLRFYRSPRVFRAAVSKRTRGRFDHSFAFADYATSTGHVALQPYLSDAVLAEVGLPVLTCYQIAHEATHIWLAARVRKYLDAEDWVREGLATWIAGKVVIAGGWVTELSGDPFAATRMRRVQRLYLGRKRIYTPNDRTWYDALGSPDRYALAWCWTRFLIEDAKLNPTDLWSHDLQAKIESSASASQFRDACLAQRFDWYETGRTLQWRDGVGYQCAFADSAATAWRVGQRWPTGKSFSGNFTILPNSGDEARIVFARAADGHLFISLQAQRDVQLAWQRNAYEPETVLARSGDVRIQQGNPYEFQIWYRGGEISVKLDDRHLFKTTIDTKQPGDGWGLGAGAGSVIRWSNLELTGNVHNSSR